MSHLNEVYKIICNVSKIMLYSHKTLRGRKINTKQYLIPKFQAVRNNVQSFLNLQTHVYLYKDFSYFFESYRIHVCCQNGNRLLQGDLLFCASSSLYGMSWSDQMFNVRNDVQNFI